MERTKAVLITGAASGIGRAVCDKFLEEGHRVFALDIAECAEREGQTAFACDVTSEQSVTAVREELCHLGVKLDLIINVAGMHRMCSLVEGDVAMMKRLIDVNLCGAMTVNRIMHGLLAENGRIVIVTSEVAPLDPMPFNGLYSVSKTALDCYSQALRQELNLLGQQVITVRPGAVATPLSGGSIADTERLVSATELYSRQAKHFHGLVTGFMGVPIAPEKIATQIYKAATCRRPRLVYSKHGSLGLVLLNALPKRLQCFIIKALLNRK